MDNRYNDSFPPDSPIATMGDEQIVGMDARTQPERVAPGYAQYLQNMRLDTLAPTVRRGQAKQTNAITPGSSPLFIPFTVGTSSVITAIATDGIFASTIFADPDNNNAQYIFMATASKVYTFASDTGSVTTIAYPANELVETIDSSTNLFQDAGQVFLLRGDLGTSFSVASITAVASSTTATVHTTTSNGLSSNMYVRIAGANPTSFDGDFQITVTSPTGFTITLGGAAGTSVASGTIIMNRLKTPLVWDGNFAQPFVLNSYGVSSQNFIYMPPSDWGLLQQNRAILEYSRNEIIMSDVDQPLLYDELNGVFGFGIGTNDYLVGAAPYQDTETLVFMRYSVWLVNYVNGDVAAMTTQLVTNTVGCCSRNTIVTCGSNVLFLNERGVYMLQPGFELTLRGNSLPLSASVDPFIQTINFSAVNAAYAQYFLNRYYLAIPVNGSTRNNAMLVYNFINQAWESYDTFPNGFYCDEMQVMLDATGTPTLYLISYEGGLYAAEQNEMDDFAAAAQPATQYLINGEFQTRRFNFGSPSLKRFNRVITVAQMEANSSLTGVANTINPEDSKNLPVITNTSGVSGQTTRPGIINKRGYAVELVYQNTSGRCQIINYQIGAFVKDLKSTATT
jgi:hypothetical protein